MGGSCANYKSFKLRGLDLNIEETINIMELKLRQIDALFDASMEAENAGERFKAHGIAKNAEKIANDFEKLVDEMDCSDLDELLQEKEEAEVEDTVMFFEESGRYFERIGKRV